MKKLLFSMVILLFSQILFSQSDLPSTQIKDMKSGKKVGFNTIFEKDKVTIVNVWATWCAPCKKEIKNMSQKMPEWKKEVDFNYLTISIDEVRSEGVARTYSVSQGWEFPCYIDVNSDLKRSLNFQSCPFTFVIDKTGTIIYKHIGYEEGAENEIFELIKNVKSNTH